MHDNEKNNLLALKDGQPKSNERYLQNYSLSTTGSNVEVPQEDGGPWTNGTIIGHGSSDHNSRSCWIRVTKMGCTFTRANGHVMTTPMSVGDYLRNELSKAKQQHVADRFDKLLDHLAHIHK